MATRTYEDVKAAEALNRALNHVLGVSLLANVALDSPSLGLRPFLSDDGSSLLDGSAGNGCRR